MSDSCTFFGHRDCPETVRAALRATITELIEHHKVSCFYVGDSGRFDALCRAELKDLGANYSVIRSRMPSRSERYEDASDGILPEGIVEGGPPRFAIERRNRWILERSSFVVCYLRQQSFGGAAKFVSLAKRKGKTVINLYSAITPP